MHHWHCLSSTAFFRCRLSSSVVVGKAQVWEATSSSLPSPSLISFLPSHYTHTACLPCLPACLHLSPVTVTRSLSFSSSFLLLLPSSFTDQMLSGEGRWWQGNACHTAAPAAPCLLRRRRHSPSFHHEGLFFPATPLLLQVVSACLGRRLEGMGRKVQEVSPLPACPVLFQPSSLLLFISSFAHSFSSFLHNTFVFTACQVMVGR